MAQIEEPVSQASNEELQALTPPASTLRQRAAWMYYVEEMTQSDIAKALGIGRVTVVRLLADARRRNEVRISLQGELSDCVATARQLEQRFALDEAIVVPVSSSEADPGGPISAATGYYVSDMLKPQMRFGVGWGQTLYNALGFMTEKPIADLSVVSLLGGITKAKRYNPSEFAWQFSRIFQADCHMLAAPAIVDSAATREALLERCGIKELFEGQNGMDAVLLSVGAMGKGSTSFLYGFFSENERQALLTKGAVGNILYSFFDVHGQLLDVEVNARIMSPTMELIARTPQKILVSGGTDKTEAILGAMALLKPTTLITDEYTARRLLRSFQRESSQQGQ